MAFDRVQPRRHHPLADAVLTAVEQPLLWILSRFVEITRSSWEIENGPIQNLLARGLAAAAPRLPNVALDFLCSDPRRFLLGEYGVGEQANSIALITAVAPYLDEPGLGRLEATILSWTRYRPDVEMTDRHEAAEREARLRLLKAIPEGLLTSTTAAFVRREEAELPDWDRSPYLWGHAGFVKEIPPLTKEQMIAAPDEQILDVLAGDLDGDRAKQRWDEEEGGWERPGGARAAVRELAELAKEQPERVLPLLPKLIADGNESPAADIMRSLEGSSLTDEQVYQLVRELAAQAPGRRSFAPTRPISCTGVAGRRRACRTTSALSWNVGWRCPGTPATVSFWRGTVRNRTMLVNWSPSCGHLAAASSTPTAPSGRYSLSRTAI